LASAFGLVVTVVLWLAAPLIAARVLASPQLTAALRIASLGLVASALAGAQSGALAGFEDFRGLSRLNVWAGLSGVVAVTVGVVSSGLGGALWGYNVAAAASCVLGFIALNGAARRRGVIADYRSCLSEWPVLWRFSLPTMLSNILVTPASWACNAMLVNQPNGFSEMAVYNVASQWRSLLIFLPIIVAQVFLPIMSSQASSTGSQSTRSQFLRVNVLVALPFLIGLVVLSPVILAAYGPGFRSHWPVFVVVQLATFAQIVQAPLVTSWAAEGRMWTNVFANAFWGAFLVLLSWVWIGRGALGLGLALLASFLIYFVVIWAVERGRP
jgi:O-antigen/teichoic acid export membrane protein